MSFLPDMRTFLWRLFTSIWSSSRMPSRFSISCSLAVASFPWLITASSVDPYLRLRVSKVLIL